MKQRTLSQPFTLEGVGLHTGSKSKVTVYPAAANHSIKFKLVLGDESVTIPADAYKVSSTARSTSLKSGKAEVQTVEHLLAALYALHVHNALVEVEGVELPIFDGSSKYWIDAIHQSGIVELEDDFSWTDLGETISFKDPDTGAVYTAVPSDSFELSVSIDFNSNVVAPQHASLHDLGDFEKEIGTCRTFVFLHDVLQLHQAGLIKGGQLSNAIVIAEHVPSASDIELLQSAFPDNDITIHQQGIIAEGGLSFTNEMARHKLLDVIGDLALIGHYLKAKIYVHKPSHKSNTAFAKVLKDHLKEASKYKNVPNYDPSAEPLYDILKIQSVLPHRWPFLLVDKITELNDRFVVGIKNVSFNETFFQGHFPGNPVMPGVLMIEAMAQTGGILAISLMPEEFDYDTYFLKIDNAKFKAKVGPGDTLIFKLELMEPIRRGICIMQGSTFVGKKLVAEAVLTAQLVAKPKANVGN